MFSSKKPKFAFDLTINDLSNIPQVSGHCYIELQIRDGKKLRTSMTKLLLGQSHPKDDTAAKKSSGELSKTHTSASSVEGSDGTTSTGTSGNVSIVTSVKKIHNFKCTFNYNLSCNLKFPVKKRDSSSVGNKYLLIRVYYRNERQSDDNDGEEKHSGHVETSELGRLEINLADYLRYTEPFTSKHLLKNSKVNSILSLTLFLKELPSNYDFHTQLQINDSNGNPSTDTRVGSKFVGGQATRGESGSPKNPKFDRKTFFGGLENVITDSGSGSTSSSSSEESSSEEDENNKDTNEKTAKNTREHQNGHHHHDHHNHHNHHDHHDHRNHNEEGSIIMDPIVSKFYGKILESTWDPELSVLLDQNPERCINDIFEHPKSHSSRDKQLMKTYNNWAKEFDDDDENVRHINGLISETNFREDLKSWAIGDVK